MSAGEHPAIHPLDPTDGVDAVIAAIYEQVGAPHWAARNLDALVDVLSDLSWLPPGPVRLTVSEPAPSGQSEAGESDPDDDGRARRRSVRRAQALEFALSQVVADTAGTARPVSIVREPR